MKQDANKGKIRLMKTIIIYATKHGAAGEVAQRISGKIKGSAVHNLKQGKISLADYDCVIIGASIYAGSIRKEAKTFVTQNAELLLQKKFGLYISGLETSKEKEFFETNFSKDILEKAKATALLGGIFDPKKAGPIERLIIKIIKKKVIFVNTINDAKIEQFAKTMQA